MHRVLIKSHPEYESTVTCFTRSVFKTVYFLEFFVFMFAQYNDIRQYLNQLETCCMLLVTFIYIFLTRKEPEGEAPTVEDVQQKGKSIQVF